jgi:hypothetical protein
MKSKRKPLPREYAPGYFTELARAADWPPGFVASYESSADERRRLAAERGRQQALANGTGCGAGTIVLPGTPKWLKPLSALKV